MAAMKFALLAGVIGLACALPSPTQRTTADVLKARNYEYTFEEYAREFSKEYESLEEYQTRRAVFLKNLNTIKKHNSQTPEPSWKMGVNQFTDLTSEEFGAQTRGRDRTYANYRSELNDEEMAAFQEAHKNDKPVSDLPKSLDWREKNVVTPVKNQGMCGSCWAFSASETVESQVAIKTGKLVELSEQQLVDCVPNPDSCGGTGGCNGNTQWLAFKYTDQAGMTTEEDYPYTERTGTCQTSKIHAVAHTSDYVRLPKNNYSALMNAVANVGPIAISAAAEPWQMYESGVFSNKCNTDIDHGIQLVGYGTQTGVLGDKDYWLVRNSWGASWGEKGYIRIERFGEGKEPCAEDTKPGDGTGCKGGPAEIQVCGLCGILSDSSYPTGVTAAMDEVQEM